MAQPPFNVAFAIDTSGSMQANFGGSVGDLNGDGLSDTRLDGAISAFEALNQSIIDDGLTDLVDVKVATIDSFSTASDVFEPGQDVDGYLESLRIGGGTDYADALQQTISFFDNQGSGSNVVYFASDGEPTGVSEATLDQIDTEGDALITTTPDELTAGLSASPTVPADISSVEVLLDGNVVETIDPADLTVTAFGLRFSTSITGVDIADGTPNDVSVRVVASDGDATTVQPALSVANPGGVSPVAPLTSTLAAAMPATATDLSSLLVDHGSAQISLA